LRIDCDRHIRAVVTDRAEHRRFRSQGRSAGWHQPTPFIGSVFLDLLEEARMKLWLNVTEGAEYAGVCRDTIYTACERGELHHIRIGGRRSIRLKRGVD
jgi:excisionase family DNA binding protein